MVMWNGGKKKPRSNLGGAQAGRPTCALSFHLGYGETLMGHTIRRSKRDLEAYHGGSGGVGVTHLFFADELMLFREAT